MSGRGIGIMGTLALVLAVGLLVVPAALAETPQGSPSVTQSGTATAPPDWFEREAAKAVEGVPVRPDDLPGPRGPGIVPTEPAVSAAEGGFDWTDAAIGGAAVIGVVLLTGLAVWTATRHGPTTGRHAPT